MANSMDDLQRQLLQTFQVEAQEHLQKLNETLLQLERQPDDSVRQTLLQEVFRTAHSLKGAARAVSLTDIENLAHIMESVLQQARDAKLELKPELCDALYDALDAIQQILSGESVDTSAISARLSAAAAGEPLARAVPPQTAQSAPGEQAPSAEEVPSAEGVPLPEAAKKTTARKAAAKKTAPKQDAPAQPELPPSTPSLPPRPTQPEPASAEASLVPGEETIRVAVSKLDDLMAQAGELIMAEISAGQHLADVRALRDRVSRWPKLWREIKPLLSRLQGDAGRRLAELLLRHQEFMQALTRDINALEQTISRDTLNLSMSMTRLQDEVRRVRLVPIQTLAPVLQRAVRDAARSENKLVAFTLNGGDVELDKKVLETLKDPLLHLLRNAIIHGIERPEVRKAAGKRGEGQVGLTVRQQGSEVHISVFDDGRGFDIEALRRTSAERGGTVFDDDADPDDIIMAVAFQPGMTTMHHVTELAGRGVGLDVVRQSIVDLRGRIRIENKPGEGATIHLVVPVSLTMSRGLLVQVGSERYALPLISVERIVEARESFTIGGQAALQVGDKPLPLVALSALLERPRTEIKNGKRPLAVILSVAEQRLAVQVDDVLTEQELAVKPLGSPLLHVRNVEGAALLATGEPIVVLNAAELLTSVRGAPVFKQAAVSRAQTEQAKPRTHILVVDDSITTRTLEKNILEAAGYRVTTAVDGQQALDKLNSDTERSIELVVMDVQMPHLDGFSVTEQLRQSDEFSSLPIVLVTSLESREDRERGMTAGADAYIVKRGFDQAELLAAIERLLAKEQMADG